MFAAMLLQTGGKSCVMRKDETDELLRTYEATRILKVEFPRAAFVLFPSAVVFLQDNSPAYDVDDPSTPELLDLWEKRYKQSLSE